MFRYGFLARDDVKPHKVRYYLERRDPEFETKMAEVLCVYREVAVVRPPRPVRATSQSSPMTRSRASRRSATPHPTCRRSPRFMRFSHATTERVNDFDTAIKLIVDNHSAHISKETNAWLATRPEGRFSFVFTPKHASWLNLVEGFFSKMARSMLRHIRVASKAQLKERILAYLDDIKESDSSMPPR